jgi:2-dehydropantoate 2-reductase
MEQIMAEALHVAQAVGVAVDDSVLAERLQFVDRLPGEVRASMAVDLISGRRLELPWLSGRWYGKEPSSGYPHLPTRLSAKHSS